MDDPTAEPSARTRRGEPLVRRYAATRAPADLDAAVASQMPLARRLARRYARTGLPLDDLEQVACLGLVKAIKRFDPARGWAFATFAVPTIHGELKRFCRDTAWSAHVPRPVQERVFAVRSTAAAFEGRCGRRPTVAELAALQGVAEEDVVEALLAERTLSPVSLDRPLGREMGSAATPLDGLGAEDPGYERVDCLAAIDDAMEALSFTELEMLRLRFSEELTHRQIAERLNLPVNRIGRGLRRALQRMTATATGEIAA